MQQFCLSLWGYRRGALAEDSGKFFGDFSWTIDSEGTLTISGSEKLEFFNSKALGDERLKNIVIQSGVTELGGYGEFVVCKNLKSITIPDSLTHIQENAFSYCERVGAIIVEQENPKYHSDGNCLIETNAKRLIAPFANYKMPQDGSVTSIGYMAFAYYNISDINIPEGVTNIEYGAFSKCENLEKVLLPNSLKCIGNRAFSDCVSLKSITIPEGVTSVEDFTFYNWDSLRSLQFLKA